MTNKFSIFFLSPAHQTESGQNGGRRLGPSGEFDTEDEAIAFAKLHFEEAKAQGADRVALHHADGISYPALD